MMGRFVYKNRFLFEHPEDWKTVQEALRQTDILDLADRPMNQLSGGERQRVYLARALAQETPVLLLDEPASSLDFKHQVKVYDLLKRLQIQQKKTIIMVTHDLNLAGQYCDSLVLLGKSGQTFHGSTKKVLNLSTINEVFDVECIEIAHGRSSFFFPAGEWMRKDSPDKM